MNSLLDSSDKKKIGFYIIHNTKTDETYVGSGVLGTRLNVHKTLLDKNEHWNYRLQRAYNKDPNFDFVAVPVEEGTIFENRELALEVEQSMIDEIKNSPLMLNIATNVEAPMTGFKHTKQTIEKGRQTGIRLWQNPDFRNRVIESIKQTRAKRTDEEITFYNKKLSDRLYEDYASGKRTSTKGIKLSEQFRKERSELVLDKWKDPVFRETQRIARVGKMIGPNKKAIVGDNIKYESLTQAAEKLGLTKAGISYRVDNPKDINWYRV